MVTEEINKKANIKEKLLGLSFSSVLFFIVYNFSSWYAAHSARVGSFVFDFEYNIPFISWMIIPYMSSGLLFVIIFLMCSCKDELVLLVKRINFVTISSGLLFILFPLQYSFVRPKVDSSFLHFFYQFLNTWDTNYNQAPSLHISYGLIFWSVFRQHLSGGWKIITGIWLLAMIVSTHTVYQHHSIDAIAALLLIGITFLIFPDNLNK